ncbi:MAG: STAS domain-containing protein [Gemmataceae bacterium]
MSLTSPTHLKCQLEGEVLVITLTEQELRGEDLTDTVLQELQEAVASAPSPLKIALDLQQVKFVTSSGLAMLLRFRRYVREQDGQLLLCGLSPLVAEVLLTTKLASSTPSMVIPFAMVPDVNAALTHFTKQAF